MSDVSIALIDAVHKFFVGYKVWIRSRLPEGEANPARLLTLVFLRRMAPITMGVLSARLALPKSNITLLVDELEREGLVVRRAHPGDRRAKLLELTAQGQRFARRVGVDYDRTVATLFEVLSEDARAAFLATLQTLTDNLRTGGTGGKAESGSGNFGAVARGNPLNKRGKPRVS